MNNSSFYLLDNRGSLLHHHDYHVAEQRSSSHGKFTLPSCGVPIASCHEELLEHSRKLLLQQNIIPLGSALTSPSLLVNGSGLRNNKIVESKFSIPPLSVVEARGLFRKNAGRSGSFTNNTFAEPTTTKPSTALPPKQKVGTGVYFNNTEIIAGESHLPGSAMPNTSTTSTSSSINPSPFGGPLMAPPALHCIYNANEQTPTALQHVTFQNDSTISLQQIAESLVLHTTSTTKQEQEQEKEKKDGQNKGENNEWDQKTSRSLFISSANTTTATRYSKKKMIMMKHEQDLLKDVVSSLSSNSHSNAKRRKLSQDEETFLQAAAKLSSLG